MQAPWQQPLPASPGPSLPDEPDELVGLLSEVIVIMFKFQEESQQSLQHLFKKNTRRFTVTDILVILQSVKDNLDSDDDWKPATSW